jgi:hypothetical protein
MEAETFTCGTQPACTFFDAFVISKNGVPQGLYCTFYNTTYGPEDATNYGQTNNNGDRYTVSESYAYTLTQPPPCNLVADADFSSLSLSTTPWSLGVTPFGAVTTKQNCHAGTSCAAITFSPLTTIATISQGPLNTVSGKNYVLSFYFTTNTNILSVCTIQAKYPGLTWTEGFFSVPWTLVQIPFTAGASGNVTFTLQCTGAVPATASIAAVEVSLNA